MPALSSPALRLRVVQLNPHRPHPVDVQPDAATRAALAAEFGLIALPALHLTGALSVYGARDWQFEGRLRAEVVQPCVVTLAPVTTRIDEPVRRRWSPDVTDPEGEEVEMSDDEVDPLGTVIDLGAMLGEALTLALPAYPRAKGAALEADAEAEQGSEPTDERRKPFADLSALLARKTRD